MGKQSKIQVKVTLDSKAASDFSGPRAFCCRATQLMWPFWHKHNETAQTTWNNKVSSKPNVAHRKYGQAPPASRSSSHVSTSCRQCYSTTTWTRVSGPLHRPRVALMNSALHRRVARWELSLSCLCLRCRLWVHVFAAVAAHLPPVASSQPWSSLCWKSSHFILRKIFRNRRRWTRDLM